ncbi:MAG TPA: copper ion binding protein, partial [Thermodesulfovibrionales bacterium]|nr:copper ion binding protein [Thermodesulfovibrionales bacterium]
MKKKVELPITGMTCAACALSVERGLGRISGVTNASVNFASEKATVEMEDRVDLRTIAKVVKEEGYGLLAGRMDFAVRGMTCAACVAAVEKALKGIYGVLDATVNLAAERASVEYIPTIVNFDDFKKAVSDAGYSAEMIREDYVDREKEQRDLDFSDIRKKFVVSAV